MEDEDFSPTDEIAVFEQKLKKTSGRVLEDSGSSSEEEIKYAPGTQSEEVQNLKLKVSYLMQELVDKETELNSLRQALQLTKVDDDAGGADPKGKKLIEVVRRNRALQVTLESEKNRSARAMQEVVRLQEQINQAENGKGWTRSKIVTQEEDFKQKFLSMEKHYQDLKLKHHQAKEDLKKSLKIIRMEVGEYESLNKLAANEGWRGRAQTIDALRSKVNDLQRQLTAKSVSSEAPEQVSVSSRTDTSGAEERRREITALKEALEASTAECEALRKKSQGAVNRKSAVEDDMRKLRDTHQVQVKALIDKSETDDKYIASLKEEIEKLRRAKGMPVKIKTNNTGPEDPISQVKILQARVYTLETELKEKESILEMFKLQEGEAEMQGTQDYRDKIQELQEEVETLKTQQLEAVRDRSQTSSEEAKIIRELSVQNARLRKKADDLEQQLQKSKK